MRINKYLSIYNDVAKKIERGQWAPNSTLPSEHDLAETYETSRETIRKALTLLSQNGYIQKVRGKGSIVLDANKFIFPVGGLVSFKELSDKMGRQSETDVHELVLMKPDEAVQQELNISTQDDVWKIIRSRAFDGEKIILDKDYVRRAYVDTLTRDICQDSLYAYFEGELNLNISFAKKEITVEEVTEEDRRFLDLKGYDHVVVVRNHVYMDDANLLQYTESRHRMDKFRFVDFARRNQ